MVEVTQTVSVSKIYMVDTNVFRYQAYKTGDTNSNDERIRKKYKEAAKIFLNESKTKMLLLWSQMKLCMS